MYNFYVMEGKKLIDYKPTQMHYKNALVRLIDKVSNNEMQEDTLKKFIWLSVKVINSSKIEKLEHEQLEGRLQLLFFITDLMGNFTPVEFMQLFPIPKEYKGKKYGVKDYFSTMKEVEKYPLDEPIGEKILEFIMDYYNWEIFEFECQKLSIISKIRRINGELGVMESLMEENGIHMQTLRQEDNFLIDDETGERFEILKPKKKLRKLFSIVE